MKNKKKKRNKPESSCILGMEKIYRNCLWLHFYFQDYDNNPPNYICQCRNSPSHTQKKNTQKLPTVANYPQCLNQM